MSQFKQLHALAGILDSQAALPNSYPNTCVPSREGVCTTFMMDFGMTRLGLEASTYYMTGRLDNH